ncbi:MAG: hypothetical protein CM15mV18_1320 [uncultured marine virus]|nr:MAG: hypothetical protein CM15mV18_1320 [uncultured marine virus]
MSLRCVHGEITVDTTLNKVLLHDGSLQVVICSVGNLQGNIQLGKTGTNEIDTELRKSYYELRIQWNNYVR